jgi:DNA-binding GntR family transcriptional regulator
MLRSQPLQEAQSTSACATSPTTQPSSTACGRATCHDSTRPHVADDHKAIFEAALARDADLAVDLMTQHLETTARHLEAVAPSADPPAGAVIG